MPEPTFAEIVCIKCGTKFAAPGYACSRCQGGLAKVCGKCGFQNAVAKNYCDRCGTPMSLAPAAAAAEEAGSEVIPNTVVRRSGALPVPPPRPKAAPPPLGLSIPSASRMDRNLPPVADSGYVAPPPTTDSAYRRLRRQDTWAKISFWLPVLAAAAVGGFFYYQHNKPSTAIPRAAAQYLNALMRLDFDTAYGQLSTKARTHCTLDVFRALREETPWSWSDVQLVRLEPDAAVVKYRLQVSGKPPSDDFLIFLREEGKWVRPYNWNLLQSAENAFDRNDPDMALILAQEAVRINPRDPMARGYLCEAVYYRKVPAETERECALALQLTKVYPSKLSLKSLYHLHAILGDTYKNSLGKYPEALAQYDALLAFPDLSAADQCDLLLARADTRIAMGQGSEAALDLRQAAAACAKPADLDYIRKRQAQLAAPRSNP